MEQDPGNQCGGALGPGAARRRARRTEPRPETVWPAVLAGNVHQQPVLPRRHVREQLLRDAFAGVRRHAGPCHRLQGRAVRRLRFRYGARQGSRLPGGPSAAGCHPGPAGNLARRSGNPPPDRRQLPGQEPQAPQLRLCHRRGPAGNRPVQAPGGKRRNPGFHHRNHRFPGPASAEGENGRLRPLRHAGGQFRGQSRRPQAPSRRRRADGRQDPGTEFPEHRTQAEHHVCGRIAGCAADRRVLG